MNDCIGFFDSGIGGVSVMRAARRLLPNENFFYYGDNGNAPYGGYDDEKICKLSAAAIQHILDRGIKAIVIACNTATAVYMDILQSQTDIPIIGTRPALREAQSARHGGEILALATHATLNSKPFQEQLRLYGDHVIPIAGEGFVQLVESGRADSEEAAKAVEDLLHPYTAMQIDGIVLGCTHYPFLKNHFRNLFPQAVFFDGCETAAHDLADLLNVRNLRSNAFPGITEYATSGDAKTLSLIRKLSEGD